MTTRIKNLFLTCVVLTILTVFFQALAADVSREIPEELRRAFAEGIKKAEEKKSEPSSMREAIAKAQKVEQKTEEEKLEEEEEEEKVEEEEIEKPEPEKKEYLISPGDVIDIVVAEHSRYNRMVVVQANGRILYPPLGEIPVVNFTEQRLSQEIAVGLDRYIDKPQVKASVKYRIEPDETDEYIIRPGDVVDITVAGVDKYNQTVVVQPNGTILYPALGEIKAAGLTLPQLTDSITQGLSTLITSPELEVNVRKSEELPEYIERPEIKVPAPIQKFGHDFFNGARNRILKLEEGTSGKVPRTPGRVAAKIPRTPEREEELDQRLKTKDWELEAGDQRPEARDAISGFVGPVDMMEANVIASIPSKHILAPGDKLTLHFWSDIEVDIQTVSLVVDEKGEAMVPRAGKMVVRGMTLEQFQEAVREQLSRVAYKNLKLIATLDSLRSIQVFITGEAFRPGSYAVSSVTTLFNALYMCGGPSQNGSLRDIKLLRNTETKTVDFYRFLMDGDSSQDYSLNAGDTIFIPQVGRTATISGEVKRPAIYELKEGENLLELISLAGGIRPSGYLQRVQIDSVKPGVERIVLDVDVSDTARADAPVFDGDTVMVFSIPSERMNTVNIEGEVRMPGQYQLKEGMTVSDLVRAAQGLLGEAYMERADLFRLNPDKKTTRLIPINLSNALAGNSEDDVTLDQWDRLVVYSKWDVKWIAERVVSAHGAVQRPGTYERSDDMTIADLLIQAGDVMPDAYLDRALLMRLDERGEMTKSIPVSLKGPERGLKLEDGDTLLVYTHRAAKWEAEREVTIEGAVQNPNVFARTDGMTVSDLIHRAGGLLPEAYPDRALLLRLDSRQRVTQGFSISPTLALQDDPKSNLELRDGDSFKVYTYQEAVWEPERKVTVVGAVHRPGDVPITEGLVAAKAEAEKSRAVTEVPEELKTEYLESTFLISQEEESGKKVSAEPLKMGSVFERVDGMRISDLIHRAGGLLPNAYLERADLRRVLPDYETYVTIPVDLARIMAEDREADILIQDEDVLTVYTIREAQYKPENIVTIYGAVQRPDIYIRSSGMKLSDLLFASGGLLPSAYKDAEITRIDDEGKPIIRTVDVMALAEGDESQNILLEDEDVVSIKKDNDFLDVLRTVTIEGEVKYPGRYTLKRDERLSGVIQRAGGLTDRAYPEASVITREVEYLAMEEQKKSVQQVKKLLEDLNQQEYEREVAKARLIEERRRDYGEWQAPTEATSVVTGVEEALPVTAVSAVAGIPEQAETTVSDIEEITRPQYTLVTPARKIENLLPAGRLVVNLREAIDNPRGKDDIIMEDGDRIVIPSIPFTVSVSGAVIQPSSLVYIKGKKVKDYIKMVGGYSRDADEEAVYTVKANGIVIRGDKATLHPGDMIVVPTKVTVQKITDRWGQVIGALKFTVTTLATVYTIRLILGRID